MLCICIALSNLFIGSKYSTFDINIGCNSSVLPAAGIALADIFAGISVASSSGGSKLSRKLNKADMYPSVAHGQKYFPALAPEYGRFKVSLFPDDNEMGDKEVGNRCMARMHMSMDHRKRQ